MQEVRRLRQARGWNQTELAFHAGLAPSVISQIENGKRNPSARTLDKLATALNVEVGDLFPKAQAPLPLEEDPEQRGAPALGALADYMLRRTQVWEQALEKEEPLFLLNALYEHVYQNQWVQTEVTMLIAAFIQTMWDAAVAEGARSPDGPPGASRAEIRDVFAADNGQDALRKAKEIAERTPDDFARWARWFQEQAKPTGIIEAFMRTLDVAAKWQNRAEATQAPTEATRLEVERHRELWADVTDEVEWPPRLARAHESAERAIKQREGLVEGLVPLFEMLRAA